MAFFPFIFFTCLTVYWCVKQKEFGICTLMSSLYAICSLMAAILAVANEVEGSGILWSGWNAELNFFPTISYCFLIGLALLPFSFIKLKEVKKIENTAPISIIVFSCIMILVAFINLYLVADSTMDILNGDIAELREAHYEGDMSPAEIKAQSMNYVFRLLLYLKWVTILALPLGFYYLCYHSRKWWWYTLLFFASLTTPISGIQEVDRTEIVFWGLMFIYCIVFFYRFFTKKIKIALVACSIFMATLGSTYLLVVSAARFEDTDNGTSLSMLQYGAQGYLNYCYFCENADFDQVATEREFPITNHYLMKIDSSKERRGERSAKQGFYISVFPSFVGDILLDLGPIGVFLWVAAYCVIAILIIRTYNRKEYNIGEVLVLFVLASIPLFGIFYYRYHTVFHGYIFITVAILYLLSRFKFIFKHEDSSSNSDV